MDRLGYTTTHSDINGDNITYTSRTNGFWYPYKRTITTSDGVTTIEHMYDNGLKIVRSRVPNSNYSVESVSHKSIVHPLFISSQKALENGNHTNGVRISEETLKLYRQFPTILKNLFRPNIEALAKDALDIFGSLSNIKTSYKTYFIDENTPVTILETKVKGNTGNYGQQKTTIIHSNGTIIVNHRYKDGLYVSRTTQNGKTEITLVSKKGIDLYNKYYPHGQENLRGIAYFTRAVEQYYNELPTYLKKVCAKSVESLLSKVRV